MENTKFLEVMASHFRIHDMEDMVDMETWTQGGVNMFIAVHKESELSYLEQFKVYVESFDVDEQIDLHRQDSSYKNAFSIRESVKDFEAYEVWLKNILTTLDR